MTLLDAIRFHVLGEQTALVVAEVSALYGAVLALNSQLDKFLSTGTLPPFGPYRACLSL